MATKRTTEVVTVTAQEIVGALQLLGYPISGAEKVEVIRKEPALDFNGLTFTCSYEDAVRPRSDQLLPAPEEKPAAEAAAGIVVEEPAPDPAPAPARPPEVDIPF